jgi:nucleoside-diphosphate-sugar epimerase
MKVLILGVAGYVGRHVAFAFWRAGHDVWGLTHGPTGARMLARREIHPVIGDVRRPETYAEVARDNDVLAHMAHQNYRHDTAAPDHLTAEGE